MERNPDIDERLWITLTKGERGFIVGSCHTFPGRFEVYFPADGRNRCVSKAEVADRSDEARYWISGFLHGSVPAPPNDQKREPDWMERRTAFLGTGEWPGLREDLLGGEPSASR